MNLKKIIGILFLISIIAFGISQIISTSETRYNPQETKIIIVGATSGIGEALAKELVRRNYTVGITGRRTELLDDMKKEMPTLHTHFMDVTKLNEARGFLKLLIDEMGGVDVIIFNAGTGNTSLTWEDQQKTVDVNVNGFLAIASEATDYFMKKGSGHIVGISSIAALRGMADAPTYSASKAFESSYLTGLRERFNKMNQEIAVTIIEPGLVDTAMGRAGRANQEWGVSDSPRGKLSELLTATAEKAAHQIADAIEQKKKHAYITKRWTPVAWLFKYLPDSLFYRLV